MNNPPDNLKKRKIAVVTGAGADYVRLKSVLQEIDKHPNLEYILVVVGAHLLERYGTTIRHIEADGFRVAKTIYTIVEGETPTTMAKSTGLGIMELATYFEDAKPDTVLIVGEHFEVFAAAVAAALMNIPVAHCRGGEVTGTIDESLRHAITKLAHIHFAATPASKERILKMGEDAERIFLVGCPSVDSLTSVPKFSKKELFLSEELDPKIKPAGQRPLDSEKPFLLLIQHPVTTEYEQSYNQIQETLAAIKELDMQTIMLWPNADAGTELIVKGIRHFLLKNSMPKLYAYKRLKAQTFINLMRLTDCFITNSSSGPSEACYFGTPVVNVGTRQNGRERGAHIIDVGYKKDEIISAVRGQLSHGKYEPEYLYGKPPVGAKMAEILATTDLSKIQKKLAY